MLYKDQKILFHLDNSRNKFLKIFDKKVCSFFSELSDLIFNDPIAKIYPELITYAFFIRAKNIILEKKKFLNSSNRYSVGKIIHFAPKNVPINFAYSLYFGLITGNVNIIKLSSKNYDQIEFIINKIDKLLKKPKFSFIKKFIYFIRYSKEDTSLTKKLIQRSDLKIIWGGDQSVKEIRSYESLPSTLEYTFPDKYSFCLVNYKEFKKLTSKEITKLIEKFYKDAYIFDQNACNSPHLLIWIGKNISKKYIENFWQKLENYSNEKNEYTEIVTSEKFNKIHDDVLTFNNIENYNQYGENLSVITLNSLDQNIFKQRGKWGYFYEFYSKDLKILNNISSKKIQTITYSGFKKEDFRKILSQRNLEGIDRIVPIGSGFDISNLWDGKNFYEIFTRIIDIK